MKNTRENGITLIALIITIIILLILASISISAVLGDNGIIKRTQEVGEKWRKAKEHDDEEVERVSDYLTTVEVMQYVNKTQNGDGTVDNGKKLVLVYTDLKDVWYVYKDKYMYDISDSGYCYNGLGYSYTFGIFIDDDEEYSRSNIKKVSAESVTDGVKINYSGEKYDVNASGTTDLRDSVATSAVCNGNDNYFNNYINICFRADVNRDKKVDEKDQKMVDAGAREN